jgi:HAD superfamily hydrolase (TIGR01549 family)
MTRSSTNHDTAPDVPKSSRSPNHRAWLVDLDGTLYRPRGVKLAMAAELLLTGLPALRTLRTFRKNHEAVRELDLDGTDASPFELQLRLTAEQLAAPRDRVERTVQSWMFERPGKWLSRFKRAELLDEIRAFRASGGRTALVSDYPARAKLEALGASALFDVVVANGEPDGPRRLKPDPEGFLKAAALLAVAPHECLVIGDREDADGEAARAAAMGFRLVG